MTTTPAPSITTFPLTASTVGPFATGFRYAAPADVVARIETDGVLGQPLAQGVDYTLTGADPLNAGGTITLSVATVPLGGWAEGQRLVLRRREARRQATALPDSEGHKPRASERALDRAMRIAEEDRDDLARALVAPAGEEELQLPAADRRKGMLLGFDPDTGAPKTSEVSIAAMASAFAKIGELASSALLPRVSVAALSLLAALPAGAVPNVWMENRAQTGDAASGQFVWDAADRSAQVAADPRKGVFVAAPGDNGSQGAWRRAFNGGVHLEWFGGGNGDPAQDQAAFEGAFRFMRATGNKLLLLEAKKYFVVDRITPPPGCTVRMIGKFDNWENQVDGAEIQTVGPGVPRRYTDITGADAADDTPVIVAGGNGVYLDGVTLRTGIDGHRWSIGAFFPCVKQCGLSRFQAFGFSDACVYLDGTWSDRNDVLKALHPEVQPSTGMNEFLATDVYLRGGGDHGFAVRIKGTTRAWDALPAADWKWAPGGTSDIRFVGGRFGSDATVTGGCLDIDAQFAEATAFSQGATFENVSFRMSSGRYVCRLDRANRIVFIGCYGEAFTGLGEFAVTSRTRQGVDGITMWADKLPIGTLTVDGVTVPGTGMALFDWAATRCVTRYRSDGRIFSPNIDASTSNRAVGLYSFATGAVIQLGGDDGVTRTAYHQFSSNQIRPMTDLAVTLGSSNYRYQVSYVQIRRWAVPGTVADFCGAGSPEGAVSAAPGSTYRRTDGDANSTFYVKPLSSGSGNTGWVAK